MNNLISESFSYQDLKRKNSVPERKIFIFEILEEKFPFF